MKKNSLIVLSLILFCFCSVTPANATAISIANTYSDWDSLAILGGTLGVDYTAWYDKASLGFANASTNLVPSSQVGPNTISSWVSTSSTREITNAKGAAYTTPSLVAAEAAATSDGFTTTNAWASGSTHRVGSFDLLTNKTLSFQVPFTYFHNITMPLAGDVASAYSQASLVLIKDIGGKGYFDQNDYDNYIDQTIFGYSNNTEGIFEDGATINVIGELAAGEKYGLELHLYSSAYTEALEREGDTSGGNPVPEPMSMLLFGSGLAGMAFTRRRKKA